MSHTLYNADATYPYISTAGGGGQYYYSATGTSGWTMLTAPHNFITSYHAISIPAVAPSNIPITASDTLSVKVGDQTGPATFLSHTFENGTNGVAIALSDVLLPGDTTPTSVNTAAATTQTYDGTLAWGGTKSARWSTTDGVGGAYPRWTGVTPSTGTIYGSFAFRGETMPSTLTRLMDARTNAAAYALGIAWNGATNKLRFQGVGPVTIADTTMTFSANTWYEIEFRVVPSATVGQFEYRIYDSTGALLETNTYTGLNTGSELSDWRFGYTLANSLPTTFNLDDISLSTVNWNNPHGILKTTGTVPVVASDTLSASVTDVAAAGQTTKAASDTPTASVTDIAAITIKQFSTASDTLSASVTDVASAGQTTKAATDTPTASVNDVSAVSIINYVVASDALSASVTGVSTLAPIPFAASDTLTATVTDVGAFSTVVVSAADTLSAAISESVGDSVRFSAADTLTSTVTETTAFNTQPITASDTLSASVVETAVVAAQITASDALSASVIDTSSLGTLPFVASDTLSAAVADASAIAATLSAADTLSANVTEGTPTFNTQQLAAADTLSATVTDSFSAMKASFVGIGDNLTASVNDQGVFAPVTLSANDALSASVTDLAATFATAPAADALTAMVTESSQITISGLIAKTASDSLTAAVTESVNTSARVTGSDTLTITLTLESGTFAPVAVTASDAPAVSVTDVGAFSTTMVYALDALSMGVFDNAVVDITYLPKTASDTLSASVTEATQFAIVSVQASDTLSASVSETATFPPVAAVASDTLSAAVTESVIQSVVNPATDVLTVQLSETTNIAISGLVTLSAADTLNGVITDASAISASTVTSDDLFVNLTEGAPGLFQTGLFDKTAFDNTQTSVTDVAALFVTFASSDSLTATVNDVGTFATVAVSASDALTASVLDLGVFSTLPITASDNLNATVAENVSFATTNVSSSDTLSAAVTESVSFGTVSVSASDALSAAVTDNGALRTDFPGQDFLNVQVTDSASLVISGLVVKTANDALAASVTETAAVLASAAASDTLSASVADVSATNVARAASDTLTAMLSSENPQNVVSGAIFKTAFDDLTATVTDASALSLYGDPTADTLTASVTETVDIQIGGMIQASTFDNLQANVTETTGFSTVQITASDTLTAGLLGAATPISDNFDRNSTASFIVLTSLQPAGFNWVGHPTWMPNATITSNALWFIRGSGSNTNIDTLLGTDYDLQTQDMWAEAYPTVLTTADAKAGPAVRVDALNRTGYVLDRRQNGTIDLLRYENGSSTSLWSNAGYVTNSLKLRLEVVNDKLTGYYNDVLLFQNLVDPQPLSGTFAGAFGQPTNGNGRARLDNWAAGGFVASGEQATFSPVTVTANDNLNAAVIEDFSFGQVNLSASDILAGAVSETNYTVVPGPASDTLAMSVTETSNVVASGTTFITASDTLSAQVTDASTGTAYVTTNDLLSAAITDAGTFFLPSIVTASDALSAAVNDTGLFSTIQVSGLDTLSASVTDTRAIFLTNPGQDMLSVNVSETAQVVPSGGAILAAADDLTVALADAGAVKVNVTSFDLLYPEMTDTLTFEATRFTATDILRIQANGVLTFAQTAVTASDLLLVSVTETSHPFISRPGEDYLLVGLGEVAQILTLGLVGIAASDSLAIHTEETAYVNAISAIFATDELTIRVTETVGKDARTSRDFHGNDWIKGFDRVFRNGSWVSVPRRQ
jgi:hypothetical protein